MKNLKLLIIIFWLSHVTLYGFQEHRKKGIAERVAFLMDSIYDSTNDFGGASLAVVTKYGEVIKYAVGYSDVENKVAMETGDLMLGGSTGKLFVSTSIMQLVEKGKVDLDEKASTYLNSWPDFQKIQNHDQITVRNLLQHSTGISRYVFDEAFQVDLKKDADRIWKPEELLSYVFDQKPLFAAGESFAYSDTNYIILGMIIEKVTGMKMYEYIKLNILDPFGLDEVKPQSTRNISGLVPGYSGDNDPFYPGKVADFDNYRHNVQFEWGGGGYAVNPTQLALFAKMIYEGKAFTPELMTEYFKGIDAGQLGGQWGLGVHIRQSPFGTIYGHSGFFPGYLTNVMYYKENQMAIAFQVNTTDSKKINLYRKMFSILPLIVKE